MSTNYYRLQDGYTLEPGYTVEPLNPAYPRRTWLVTHYTGQLAAMVDEHHLGLLADRDQKAARRSGGEIMVYATGPDAEWVISEYGEAVTLGDLRRGEAP